MISFFSCRVWPTINTTVIIVILDVGVKDHRTICPHLPSFCLANTPCSPDETSTECPDRHEFFRNMECFLNHLKPYSSETSTTMCNLMGRCQHCQKWMSNQLLKWHACSGNIQYRICMKIVPIPHYYFVQVKSTPKKKTENVYSLWFWIQPRKQNSYPQSV
jgi:hypothetical protein